MNSTYELFQKARAYISSGAVGGKIFARNVRVVDVVATLTLPIGTTQAGQRIQSSFNVPGAYSGPLDASGNMPTSSAAMCIGSAMSLALPFDENAAVIISQYQALAMSTHHVVHVAGTDVIARAGAYQAAYSGLQLDGAAPAPSPSRTYQREDEPVLLVGPGERIQQLLAVRRDIVVAVSDMVVDLVCLLVVADEGED